ncbi:MAG: aldehyde dehydrogenase family protein, partial [Burkholderiaceae bacterium]|nr:aldehyde dehydrogenase family protein [Burkholderiaceae bacterium]
MTIHEFTPAQINAAVIAASRSAADWAQSPAACRAALFHALADALHAQRDALLTIAQTETSLPLPRL